MQLGSELAGGVKIVRCVEGIKSPKATL